MRTLVAMTFAILAAGYASFNISPNVAANAVANWRFDNPDEVSAVHAVIFLAVSVLGLAGGWAAGRP